jgi:hypothetical protein
MAVKPAPLPFDFSSLPLLACGEMARRGGADWSPAREERGPIPDAMRGAFALLEESARRGVKT